MKPRVIYWPGITCLLLAVLRSESWGAAVWRLYSHQQDATMVMLCRGEWCELLACDEQHASCRRRAQLNEEEDEWIS